MPFVVRSTFLVGQRFYRAGAVVADGDLILVGREALFDEFAVKVELPFVPVAPVEPVVEVEPVADPETPATVDLPAPEGEPVVDPRYTALGGPWYELADGTRIRGRAALAEALGD